MTITQENRVTFDDMSQNFPTIAELVDRTGSAVVMKDNMPRYVILDLARIGGEETAAHADVMASARNLIAATFRPSRNLPIYKRRLVWMA